MGKLRRLSFKTKPQHSRWEDLLAMWLAAEHIEALDTGWLFDHFYPIFPDASAGPCFEGWTALSYLAGRTQRLRLGLLVTGNPYRHPAVLANMAATFDVVSGGRLDLDPNTLVVVGPPPGQGNSTVPLVRGSFGSQSGPGVFGVTPVAILAQAHGGGKPALWPGSRPLPGLTRVHQTTISWTLAVPVHGPL